MRKRKFDRITPTLRDDLHWLPVPERIVFKLCLIILKRRHQTAPEYLHVLCVPVTASTSRRHSHSAARGDLQVLACRTFTFGPRSFAACAPKPGMGTRRKSSRPRRDRDAHPLPPRDIETRPRRWLHQPRRDRDETLKFRDETETGCL